MNRKAVITAVVNQKGGTGKTMTTENLGIGLAAAGKRVLLVDMDPQASLTVSLGYSNPDNLEITIAELLSRVAYEEMTVPGEGILHHQEGIDLVPSNIGLSAWEVSLVNMMSREQVLCDYLKPLRKEYDHILIDCNPSLGMLTVNALSAADDLIIPVQAQYLSVKGLEQLLRTINKVKRQINPRLKINGILLTMVDRRTNYSREISSLVREIYGKKIRVFETEIPASVRAAEISAEGKSIYLHDPKGKVAEAYRALTKEVIDYAEKARKHQVEHVR